MTAKAASLGLLLAALLACGLLVAWGMPAGDRFQMNADEGVYTRQAETVRDLGPAGFRRLAEAYLQDPVLRKFPPPYRAGHIAAGAIAAALGPAPRSLAWFSLLCHLGLPLAVYAWGRRLWGGGTALGAAVLMAFSPLGMGLGGRALMDTHANLALTVSFLALLERVRGGGRARLAVWAATALWAMLVKETCWLVYPFHAAVLFAHQARASRSEGAWPLLAAVMAGVPLLAWAILACAVGGPGRVLALLTLFRTTNSIAGSPYVAATGSGPWHEYLVDQVLLSPLTCLMAALGSGLWLARTRREPAGGVLPALWAGYLLAWLAFMPKNPRYALGLDLPIRLAAAGGMWLLARHVAGRGVWRPVVYGGGIIGLAALEVGTFHRVFIDHQVYDPVASNLMAAFNMVGTEQPAKPVAQVGPGAHAPSLVELIAASNAAYHRKDFPAAERLCLQAIVLAPGSPAAWNNLCAALCEMGQWDRAILAGEKASALAPGEPLARNNLAWARRGRQAAPGPKP